MNTKVSFLALGDSYTIGESVSEEGRWPNQLTRKFNLNNEITIQKADIVATTGWTTDELQTGINQAQLKSNYDLVSLLIGVNNQYRGLNIEQFKNEFEQLLQFAIQKAGSADGVIVISIPDWGVMPFAEGRNREQIALEIDQYNKAKKAISASYDVTFVSITDISRDVQSHPEYIAEDGLHPSEKQYAAWVKKLLPVIELKLNE